MIALNRIGMNTIYVEAWLDGYTLFHSNTLYNQIGEYISPLLLQQGRDLIAESVQFGKQQNNLTVIAWFEFGNMMSLGDSYNALRRKRPEWILKNQQGSEVAPDGFVWMNIAIPEAQDFLINITMECLDNYKVDGIQFDDHMAWPVSMGYDDYTRALYRLERSKEVPTDYTDAEFVAWRASKVTEFAIRLTSAVRLKHPLVILSVSPSVFSFSYEQFCTDWLLWYHSKLFDEYIPQAYRHSFERFKTAWDEQIHYLQDSTEGLVAGVMFEEGDFLIDWNEAQQMLQYTRTSKSQGHVIWFSKSVLGSFSLELYKYYHYSSSAL